MFKLTGVTAGVGTADSIGAGVTVDVGEAVGDPVGVGVGEVVIVGVGEGVGVETMPPTSKSLEVALADTPPCSTVTRMFVV